MYNYYVFNFERASFKSSFPYLVGTKLLTELFKKEITTSVNLTNKVNFNS